MKWRSSHRRKNFTRLKNGATKTSYKSSLSLLSRHPQHAPPPHCCAASTMKSASCSFQHLEFSFLLKERVCPLIIKLFSPSLKYRQGMPVPASSSANEKPYFPIVMRLLRIVAVLITHYYTLMVSIPEAFRLQFCWKQ